jgi:hypothetical protein
MAKEFLTRKKTRLFGGLLVLLGLLFGYQNCSPGFVSVSANPTSELGSEATPNDPGDDGSTPAPAPDPVVDPTPAPTPDPVPNPTPDPVVDPTPTLSPPAPLPDYSKIHFMASPDISFQDTAKNSRTDYMLVARANPEMYRDGMDPPVIQIRSIPDPAHILKADGVTRFARVKDPILGGDHLSFLLRVLPGDNIKWSSPSTRLEVAPQSTSTLTPGREYLIALAYTAPSVDVVANSSFLIMLQIHAEQGGNPPIRFFNSGNGRIQISRTASPDIPLGGQFETIYDGTMSKTQYEGFLIRTRIAASASGNPYLKVWRAPGLSNWTQIVDDKRPNTYLAYPNHSLRPRFGPYGTTNLVPESAGREGMVIYHKGMIIFDVTANPNITNEMMLNHLRDL